MENKAFPQLYQTPEFFGIHRDLFSLGIVVAYILFVITKAFWICSSMAIACMLYLNYYLRQDPQYFRLIRKGRRIRKQALGFHRAYDRVSQKPIKRIIIREE